MAESIYITAHLRGFEKIAGITGVHRVAIHSNAFMYLLFATNNSTNKGNRRGFRVCF